MLLASRTSTRGCVVKCSEDSRRYEHSSLRVMSDCLVLHGGCGQHKRCRGIHVPVFARHGGRAANGSRRTDMASRRSPVRPCPAASWSAGRGDHHYSNGVWSSQVSFAGPVTSLTCTSVAFCVAVQRDRGDGGIAITYAHGKWSTKNGGVISEPSAVSCASTSFCVALGRNARVFLLRWHVVERSTPRIGHHTVLSVVSLAFILHGGWGLRDNRRSAPRLWLYVLERRLVDRAEARQRALFRVLPHLEALHCRRSSGTRPHLLGWSLELAAIAEGVAMRQLEACGSRRHPTSTRLRPAS